MSDAKSKRAWRSARRLFRWFRIAALLLVLTLAGFLFYWNQAGLPGFVKNAILAELRSRGLELSFAKIRFRWDRGIVAEQVAFGRAQLVSGPELTLDELAIGLEPEQLLRGKVRVNELNLRGGRLAWHFAGTNQPAVPLVVQKINGQLLLRGAVADLKSFGGEFHGAAFQLRGACTNVPQGIALWKSQATNAAAQGTNQLTTGTVDAVLRRFAHSLTNWQFTGRPDLQVTFGVDGTNLPASVIAVHLRAPQASTPFGQYRNFDLEAAAPPISPEAATRHFGLGISADEFVTPWGQGSGASARTSLDAPWDFAATTNFSAHIQLQRLATEWGNGTNLVVTLEVANGRTNVTCRAGSLATPWARATEARLAAHWLATPAKTISLEAELQAAHLTVTNAGTAGPSHVQVHGQWDDFRTEPKFIRASLSLTNAATPWGAAREAEVTLELSANTNWLGALRATNQLVWDRLKPLHLQWDARLVEARSHKLECPRLELAGDWQTPNLAVKKFRAVFPEGPLELTGRLDTATRELRADVQSAFDFRRIAPLLPATNQTYLAGWDWTKPPRMDAQVALVLPAWTNPAPAWSTEVWPTLAATASIKLEPGKYRGLVVDDARARLNFSNQVARVSDFFLRSGEHQFWADATGDLARAEFQLDARCLATPEVARPLVGTNVQRGFDLAKFSTPLWLESRVTGNWKRAETIQFDALIRATNLVFREVPLDRVETRARFASNVLSFTKPLVARPEGQAEADAVVVDFNRQMVYLTNAHGCLEPAAVGRAIGPHILKTIAPYKFSRPPQARVEGSIPMHGEAGARVRFDVAGGPFNWWEFNTTNVTGTVWWIEQSVAITNLEASFYGGRLVGDLAIDFRTPKQSGMALQLNVSDVRFAELMQDISDRTNMVEGRLAGRLVVAKAILEDWKSWQGYGNVQMTDGLIWDLPVFGIFSPILNAISPGLGNSRAREGTATFAITNSVIRTDDLLINAKGYDLKYNGTVDFDYRVDARVEAEILREAWLVGTALNLVFKPLTKLFEYRVTGTLSDPKTKPVYIPKFITALLSPVKTLKEALSKDQPKDPKGGDPVVPK